MAGSVLDAFVRLVADKTEIDKALHDEIPKAAEEAGDEGGSRLSKAMGGRVKSLVGGLIGTAVGGAIGMAISGSAELNQATTEFRAEVGATAEDAAKAQSTISGLYKSNTQQFGEIGKTLATLRTDMGLTQDEADAAAQSFLDFSKVSGQDGPAAVKQFDDILDAFNLSAGDSQGIMDKLVLSHQKYGGSITENADALSNMAPQLKALNLGVDDGIGLLNLFASSGIDASASQRALNAAVKNLPPGTTMDDVIKKLSSIEDPAARAQAAMDIFGTKAGVALANAIKPGMTSLDEFKVSAEEAAGASQKAADTLDSSFGTQFQLMLKNVGGTLADVGGIFGPFLQGAAMVFGPQLTTLVTAGLGGLAGVMAPLLSGLGTVLSTVMGAVGTALGTVMDLAIAAAPILLPALLIAAIIAAIALIINDPSIPGKALDIGVGIVRGIIEGAVALGGMLLDLLTGAINAIVTVGPQLISGIVGFILSIPERAAGLVGDLLGLAGRAFAGVVSAAGGLAGDVVAAILSIPGKAAQWAVDLVGQATRLAVDVLKAVAQLAVDIVNAVLGIPEKAAKWIVDLLAQAAQLAVDVGGKISELVGNIVGFFLGIPASLINLGSQLVSTIINGLAALPGQLLDTITGAFRNAFENLKIDIGPFHISGRDGITIDLPHIDLPKFDVGSKFVPADMLAMVHRGEIIVPADEAEAVRTGRLSIGTPPAPMQIGGGGTQVINIYNPVPERSEDSARRHLQALAAFAR